MLDSVSLTASTCTKIGINSRCARRCGLRNLRPDLVMAQECRPPESSQRRQLSDPN